MRLRFAEPGFCVKKSLGQAHFFAPENSPVAAFPNPGSSSSTPGFAG
jgi:hypothetical protein